MLNAQDTFRQQSASFAGLAVLHLRDGHVRQAVAAQIASDLSAARGLGFAEGRPEMLLAFADAIAADDLLTEGHDAFDVITDVRAHLSALLWEPARGLWESERQPVTMFAGRVVEPGVVDDMVNGMPLGEVAAAWEQEAEGQLANADLYMTRGDSAAALDAYRASDLARFAAFTTRRSLEVGDREMLQAGLRLQLAHGAVDSAPRSASVRASLRVIRARLLWALDPSDAEGFAEVFPPLPYA